ncbi:DNA polymerase sigma subunit [Ceratobasidium sp. AG-Ba]|nr:DNA polymerase sigma subunit [Ceratobasidium sp. AG-Ba]
MYSDIDLVVSSGNIARNPNSCWIARALRDQGLANNVQVIAKAKVPIVKFEQLGVRKLLRVYATNSDIHAGGFKVDISLNQANGVTVFKAFLSQRDMNECTMVVWGYSVVAWYYVLSCS